MRYPCPTTHAFLYLRTLAPPAKAYHKGAVFWRVRTPRYAIREIFNEHMSTSYYFLVLFFSQSGDTIGPRAGSVSRGLDRLVIAHRRVSALSSAAGPGPAKQLTRLDSAWRVHDN